MTIAPQMPPGLDPLPGTSDADRGRRRRPGRLGDLLTVLVLVATVATAIALRYDPPDPAAVAAPAPAPRDPAPQDPGAPVTSAPVPTVDTTAPRAAGVTAPGRVLPTNREGGRITDLSDAGDAVGVEGTVAGGDDGTGLRPVRWRGPEAVPLPGAGGWRAPLISAVAVVAYTAARNGSTVAAVQDGEDVMRFPEDGTLATDVEGGRVLVARPESGTAAADDALWDPRAGTVTKLGFTGSFLVPGGGVVGTVPVLAAGPGGAEPFTRPVLWRDGRRIDLEVPEGWRARALGGHGDLVVGTAVREPAADDSPSVPVMWQDGRITFLPALGGQRAVAVAVNAGGLIAGTSQTPDGRRHAVLWRGGRVRDLGTLGDRESRATGISVHGVVVGVSEAPDGVEHAVAWVDGRIVDVGAGLGLPDTASAAHGVVGDRIYGVATGPDGVERPALWQLNRVSRG